MLRKVACKASLLASGNLSGKQFSILKEKEVTKVAHYAQAV